MHAPVHEEASFSVPAPEVVHQTLPEVHQKTSDKSANLPPPIVFGPKSTFSWPDGVKFEEVREHDLYILDRINVKGKGVFEVGNVVVDDSVGTATPSGLVGIACHAHGPKVEFWTSSDKVTLSTAKAGHLATAPPGTKALQTLQDQKRLF